jgi:CRISPR-associated protein Cas2
MEYYVIVYDITDDKRRNRIFKILKNYATPVQYSVFEAHIHPNALVELKYKMWSTMNTKEDSIYFYRQCECCQGKIDKMGISRYIYGSEDIII